MIQTSCLVLHSIKFKEHDRIYTLFTRERGKVQARGRGVRKINSKIGPHLQPLSIIDIQLVEGREWYTITGAHNTSLIFQISSNILEVSMFVSEILKKSLPEEEPLESFFDTLQELLPILLNKQHPLLFQKALFLMQYLKHTGHAPELCECLHCHKEKDQYCFDIKHSGIVCHQCSGNHSQSHEMFVYHLKNLYELDRIDSSKELHPEQVQYLYNTMETLFYQAFAINLKIKK